MPNGKKIERLSQPAQTDEKRSTFIGFKSCGIYFPGNITPSIITQAAIIVPLAVHFIVTRIVDQFVQALVEKLAVIVFIALDIINAYVNDPIMMNEVLEKNELGVEIVGQSLVNDDMGIVLKNGEDGEELKALLDPIIEQLKQDGTLSELSTKWTGGDYIPE